MTISFRRKVRFTATGSTGLIVNPGGWDMTDLKISFSVAKSLSSSANDAEIAIYNLTEGHRNALGRELEDIRLEAGYIPPNGDDNTGVIFTGQIREVRHERQGADIISRVFSGDGDRTLRRADVSKTFPAGTKIEDIFDHVAEELEKQGAVKGEMKLPPDLPPTKRPYSMAGSARREMDRLGRMAKTYWSIQNGVIETVPGDDFIGTVLSFDADTGLVDVPTITDNGVSATVLLNPEIRPGRRVQIKSDLVELNAEDGIYRVSSVSFNGDNRDGRFLAEIEGESVRNGKVDEGER